MSEWINQSHQVSQWERLLQLYIAKYSENSIWGSVLLHFICNKTLVICAHSYVLNLFTAFNVLVEK